MYHHIIWFHSVRDFGLFEHEIGAWWKELVTFSDGQTGSDDRYQAIYHSESPLDKEQQIDVQGAYHWIADTSFNISDDDVKHPREEEQDESIIALDCQLGKDAASLIAHYFPGSTITSIRSEYHSGVFIGDFSIALTCAVDHPFLQQVVIGFNQEDVPGRPDSWQTLCSLHVSLYITRFTLINPTSSKPITYGLPGMYQEAMGKWCATHDDGMLYGHVETPDMFIVTTELLGHSYEEVEHTAKLLAVQAKAKLERENSWTASSDAGDPFNAEEA